ncbi:MAG: hypothetical protein U0T79_06345 [Ferruginibacter sp.]
MENWLLKAKHWVIFTLTFGLLFLAQLIFLPFLILAEDPMPAFSIMGPACMMIYLIFFYWMYATGINLYKKLPPAVEMNLKRFKAFIIIPMLYLVCLSVLMFFLFNGGFSIQPDTHLGGVATAFFLIVPVHFFSIFCIFYCFYFNAKALKAVELQQPVTFNDFGLDFILFWFYPIGVWFIQPRINKIFSDDPGVVRGY